MERVNELVLNPVGMGLGGWQRSVGEAMTLDSSGSRMEGQAWRRETRREVARGLQGDSGAVSPPVTTEMEKEH